MAIGVARCMCAVGALAGLSVSVASADLTDDVFTINARVGNQDGSFVVHADDGWFDGRGNFYWSLGAETPIKGDDGSVLATLSTASIVVFQDPVISLNFTVQAGGSDTQFDIGSGLLSFSQIANPTGRASAGVTVTDVTGNGAKMWPEGDSMYSAQYNGLYPNGTPFADLLTDSVSAGIFQTGIASDEYPSGGQFAVIGEAVDSMSSAWHFNLTAGDVASGTSVFVVVPAPASAGLLAVGGLALVRRRR